MVCVYVHAITMQAINTSQLQGKSYLLRVNSYWQAWTNQELEFNSCLIYAELWTQILHTHQDGLKG